MTNVLRGATIGSGAVVLTRPRAADGLTIRVPGQAVAAPAGQLPSADDAISLHAQELYREAKAAGRAAGLSEGKEKAAIAASQEIEQAVKAAVKQATEPLNEATLRLQAMVRQLHSAADGVLADAEDDVVALCFDVLCNLLGRALVSREGLRAVVAQAVSQARQSAETVVLVHPQDLALVMRGEEGADDLASATPQLQGARWVADERVALGGCIVQSASGGIDARLETLLDAVRRLLLDARQASSSAVASSGVQP